MRRQLGFTLVELMVVMVVLGILAAVAGPRVLDRTALLERGFQDQVQSLLRQSRNTAVAQRRLVCVERVGGAAPAVRASYGCGGALLQSTSGEPLSVPVPSGTTVGGAASIVFTAEGRLQPLADRSFVVGVRTLTVNRETGVAVYQN